MAQAPTFEDALKTLEEAVARLEQGQLPLNEALSCFENGVRSAGRCRELLGEATTRVDLLLKDSGGGLRTTPFAGVDNGDDEE